MIKICPNPHCSEIAHNIEKTETHCRNCDAVMVAINDKTYREKFIHDPLQFDYRTGKMTCAADQGYSVQLSIDLF